MNYKDIFTAAFSEAAPLKDEEIAAREIIEKGKAMKTTKHSARKIFTSIAAAAAVLIVGGVSVGAATGWDFIGAFNKVFADRAEDASYVSPIDFSKMGKELDVKFEGEDYTIDFRGVAASSKTLFMLYDITFTEEFLSEHGECDIITAFITSRMSGNGGGQSEIYNVDGNTYSLYYSYNCYDTKITEGKSINVRIGGIGLYDGNDHITIDCEHEFKLNIDFDILEDVCTVDVNEEIQAGEDTVILDKIVYDAFTIDLQFSYVGLPDAIWELDDIARYNSYITRTDGTQMELTGIGGSCANHSNGIISADFNIPILPEEIESITFGDITIPLT